MCISGIKFYNYNKAEEDTLRGAKLVVILVDNKLVTPKKGITLRKGPGVNNPLLDFGQIVQIPYKEGWKTDDIIPMQKPFNDIGLF